MYRLVFAAVLLGVLTSGCGSNEGETITVTQPPAEQQMETALRNLAESGEPLGSGGLTIEEGIASVRQRDPAKADALQQDYETLVAASNPGAVKAAAQSMLSKL